MKRRLIVVLTLMMAFCLSACGNESQKSDTPAPKETISEEELAGVWESYGEGSSQNEVSDESKSGEVMKLTFHNDYTAEWSQNGVDTGTLYWKMPNEKVYLYDAPEMELITMKATFHNGDMVMQTGTDEYVFLKKTEESTETFGSDYEESGKGFAKETNMLGDTYYFGYVEITNTGTTNLELGDCIFDFEDNDGHLLMSDDYLNAYPKVIAPGEKGYFFTNLSGIDDSVSMDNGFNFVPSYKVSESKKNAVRYEVTDTDLRDDDYKGVKVTGRITNNTSQDESSCYVFVIFRDADGNPLSIERTYADDLAAGETKSFEISTAISAITLQASDIDSYEVIACPTHVW